METPRSFKDGKGRNWIVAVPFDAIVQVLARVGLDLRQLVEDHDHTSRELDDPRKLKQVLAVLLEAQLEKVGTTIDDLFVAIKTEAQMTAMIMCVYQATFDFFQSQGEVLNNALEKVMRAQETAGKNTAKRLRNSIENGKMDRMLEIVMDPELAAAWVLAARDSKNTDLAAAWKEVEEAQLPPAKLVPAFIRLVVERELTLPETKPSTPSASAGASPVSLGSIPAPTPGGSSV